GKRRQRLLAEYDVLVDLGLELGEEAIVHLRGLRRDDRLARGRTAVRSGEEPQDRGRRHESQRSCRQGGAHLPGGVGDAALIRVGFRISRETTWNRHAAPPRHAWRPTQRRTPALRGRK